MTRANKTIDAPPRLVESVSDWVVGRFGARVLKAAEASLEWPLHRDQEIVELHLIRRIAAEWVAKGEEAAPPAAQSSARAIFPFDLTGWRHEPMFSRLPWEDQELLAQSDMPAGPIVVEVVAAQGRSESLALGHEAVLAEWRPTRRQLRVLIPVPDLRTGDVAEAAHDLRKMVRHELQHAAQDLLESIARARAGMPPLRARVKPHAPALHALLDHEFTTRLQDEIDDFRRHAARIPRAVRRAALRVWVDEVPGTAAKLPGAAKLLHPRRFFYDLHFHAPERWRKAVRVFASEVGDLL